MTTTNTPTNPTPTSTQKNPQSSPTTTTPTTIATPQPPSSSLETTTSATAGSSAFGMIRHHSRPPRSARQTSSSRFSSTLNNNNSYYPNLRNSSARGATVSVVGLGGRRSHVYGGEVVVPGFGFGFGLGEMDRYTGGRRGGGGGRGSGGEGEGEGGGGGGGGGARAAADDIGTYWDETDVDTWNNTQDRNEEAIAEENGDLEGRAVQGTREHQSDSCLSLSFEFEEDGKRADEWADLTISAVLDRSKDVEREKHREPREWDQRQDRDRGVEPLRFKPKRPIPDLSMRQRDGEGHWSGLGWQPGTNRIGRNRGMAAVLGKGAPPSAQISFAPGEIVVVGNRFWF